MVDFGQKLRQLRKEKSLTQKQLAKMVGIHSSIISFYELGDRSPSLDILVRIARELHVSTDYLLGVEKGESVDISMLSDKDKALVRSVVDSLREKNNA